MTEITDTPIDQNGPMKRFDSIDEAVKEINKAYDTRDRVRLARAATALSLQLIMEME